MIRYQKRLTNQEQGRYNYSTTNFIMEKEQISLLPYAVLTLAISVSALTVVFT